MCGICGIAIPEKLNRAVDAAALVRMRDTLEHRGPDDAGVFIDGAIGLAHRRLSIVDLAGGHQPMSNEDGRVWITYNGEVYNHRDLRPALEERGHVYQTASDTETIIHLYEDYGPHAVEQLRGMFAFAIWDKSRKRLVLARDRLGIKPLYYTLSDDGVICFASEIKALVETRAFRAELNYDALADYAANRSTSGETTLFRGVKRLPPGCLLVWSDGRVHIERYWDLRFAKPAEPLSDGEYVDQFEDLFKESVRLRLMADVPLGMFLSGGIDSSAIVAAMSEMVSEPIKTFSVAFEEREANELEYARLVARAFGTDHHEVVVSPQQFFDALPALVYQEDEPIAHPSSVPLYFVSKLAKQAVPKARFRIVGRNPHPRVQKLASDSIEVTGTVASVIEHYREATINIVPLRVGGGTRLKIYEAMAMGKATVSTSIGAEGLDVNDGADIAIADSSEKFAEAMIALLKNEQLRQRIEKAAAEKAARYDWSVITERFEDVLERVAGQGLGAQASLPASSFANARQTGMPALPEGLK